MAFLVLLGLVAAVVFAAISIYNRLVTGRNGYKNAYSQTSSRTWSRPPRPT
jgi:hypothetical protein